MKKYINPNTESVLLQGGFLMGSPTGDAPTDGPATPPETLPDQLAPGRKVF